MDNAEKLPITAGYCKAGRIYFKKVLGGRPCGNRRNVSGNALSAINKSEVNEDEFSNLTKFIDGKLKNK
jgi:hypothetical protein